MVRLDGKSTVVELEVVQGDMPNFFVEAQTIADGRVHTEAKQIVVPPEKRVLNVDVEPSSAAYQPGEKAKVKIRLTDDAGSPVVGATVVTIYDKALEYISGGSNVGDIEGILRDGAASTTRRPKTTSTATRATSSRPAKNTCSRSGCSGTWSTTNLTLGRAQPRPAGLAVCEVGEQAVGP